MRLLCTPWFQTGMILLARKPQINFNFPCRSVFVESDLAELSCEQRTLASSPYRLSGRRSTCAGVTPSCWDWLDSF